MDQLLIVISCILLCGLCAATSILCVSLSKANEAIADIKVGLSAYKQLLIDTRDMCAEHRDVLESFVFGKEKDWAKEKDQLLAKLDAQWERLLQMKISQATNDLNPLMRTSIERVNRMMKEAGEQELEVPKPNAEVAMAGDSFDS